MLFFSGRLLNCEQRKGNNMQQKKSKSEQMIGNQRAKLGTHESMVMRLPVYVVDGLYACLETEECPEPNKRDVLELALNVLQNHIEEKTGRIIPRPFIHEDEEVLDMLDGERGQNP